jgi:hypothetical protein
MCTLTWRFDRDGLFLCFNRDEKRTRRPALPPGPRILDGVRLLTPTDGDAGGSWLAVNEFGLAVAVLNYYEADSPVSGPTPATHESRGHLVLRMAASRSWPELLARMEALRCENYRPFYLVLFSGLGEVSMMRWNGVVLERSVLNEGHLPVTTSSFQTEEVTACRRSMFQRLLRDRGGVSPEMLAEFHHSRDERGGAYSVTMTRPDALTVSFSSVRIGNERATFYYQPRWTEGVDPGYLSGQTFALETSR